jgi:hypothetical protein
MEISENKEWDDVPDSVKRDPSPLVKYRLKFKEFEHMKKRYPDFDSHRKEIALFLKRHRALDVQCDMTVLELIYLYVREKSKGGLQDADL